LLKVSINTELIEDYPALVEGLKKLNKSDPSVEVYTSSKGDLILSTCGEVHLERCINDLEKTLALVKVRYSEPIVSFKETIIYNNILEINNKTNIEAA
jgi:ribosome assembly protein 1